MTPIFSGEETDNPKIIICEICEIDDRFSLINSRSYILGLIGKIRDMNAKKTDLQVNLTLLKASQMRYPESPAEARLEVFENQYGDRDYWITFDCPEFTARCPITSQPDFGAITIRYIPQKYCIESKSLKLYLFSFRNYGTFHEAVVNRILDDLVAACHPKRMIVLGDFNPRGGIGIHVEVEYVMPAAA